MDKYGFSPRLAQRCAAATIVSSFELPTQPHQYLSISVGFLAPTVPLRPAKTVCLYSTLKIADARDKHKTARWAAPRGVGNQAWTSRNRFIDQSHQSHISVQRPPSVAVDQRDKKR
jgi:hypothetical protein